MYFNAYSFLKRNRVLFDLEKLTFTAQKDRQLRVTAKYLKKFYLTSNTVDLEPLNLDSRCLQITWNFVVLF